MSVYTPVEPQQLETLLKHYVLGELVNYQGISAGIENTNYFVTTTRGEFVLTLFEQMGYEELPYFLELMAYLAEHRVPSAHPEADSEGHYLREFCGKPTALVKRLRGQDVKSPQAAHCSALGAALGHMHTATSGFPLYRANTRGPRWWHDTAEKIQEYLSHEERTLLQDELNYQLAFRTLDLPRGVIHADLFRDNALFEGESLSGIIDFYYACDDVLLYDVAITANDWCVAADGGLEPELLHAFLQAYHQARPFTSNERKAWAVMLRAAALRFWLSRLQDQYFPRPGELTHIKDPNVFKRILQARQHLPDACRLPD